MTKTQHKRTAAASMFQMGISRNTKYAVRDGFRKDSHIVIPLYHVLHFIIIIVMIDINKSRLHACILKLLASKLQQNHLLAA